MLTASPILKLWHHRRPWERLSGAARNHSAALFAIPIYYTSVHSQCSKILHVYIARTYKICISIYRLIVNICLLLAQFGFCCVYMLFVCRNVQQVSREYINQENWLGRALYSDNFYYTWSSGWIGVSLRRMKQLN